MLSITAFRITLIYGRLIAAEVIYQVRFNLDMMANIYLGDIQVLELAVTSLDYGAVKILVLNGLADYIRGQSSMSSYTEEVLKDGKIREYLLSATTSEGSYDYDRDPAALQLAQYHDHRHLLPILLIQGDSSGAEFWTGSGYTLLHLAARRGNINVIAWLIELGVDINAADQRGRQPLHEASKGPKDGTVASIKLLLEAGANIHAKDDISRAPIHCAAQRANFRAMGMLIKTGVDVNAVDDQGKTPLHASASGDCGKKSLECVQLLLHAGANVNVVDGVGRTPLHEAALLRRHGLQISRSLLRKGANIDARDFEGRTPLHEATFWGTKGLKTSELLLHEGANVEARDYEGRTPLHIYASTDRDKTLEFVQLLREAGANVHALDKTGNTDLHLAAAGRKNSKIIRLILQAGGDTAVTNNKGKTPQKLADRCHGKVSPKF